MDLCSTCIKEDEDSIAVIVGGLHERRRTWRQSSPWPAEYAWPVSNGCVSSLGFSQLWPVVPALFSHSLKPGGTECQCGAQRTEEEEGGREDL